MWLMHHPNEMTDEAAPPDPPSTHHTPEIHHDGLLRERDPQGEPAGPVRAPHGRADAHHPRRRRPRVPRGEQHRAAAGHHGAHAAAAPPSLSLSLLIWMARYVRSPDHIILTTSRPHPHPTPLQFKSCPLITLAPVSNDEGELEQDRDDDDPLVEGEVDESHANVRMDRPTCRCRPPVCAAALVGPIHATNPNNNNNHHHHHQPTPQDGAYHIFTEIIVKRAVTLQGDPLLMPLIDCQLSVRCFRVRASGRLGTSS